MKINNRAGMSRLFYRLNISPRFGRNFLRMIHETYFIHYLNVPVAPTVFTLINEEFTNKSVIHQ